VAHVAPGPLPGPTVERTVYVRSNDARIRHRCIGRG
jgi:hypothetical protein